jgi:hypothetical protein
MWPPFLCGVALHLFAVMSLGMFLTTFARTMPQFALLLVLMPMLSGSLFYLIPQAFLRLRPAMNLRTSVPVLSPIDQTYADRTLGSLCLPSVRQGRPIHRQWFSTVYSSAIGTPAAVKLPMARTIVGGFMSR